MCYIRYRYTIVDIVALQKKIEAALFQQQKIVEAEALEQSTDTANKILLDFHEVLIVSNT